MKYYILLQENAPCGVYTGEEDSKVIFDSGNSILAGIMHDNYIAEIEVTPDIETVLSEQINCPHYSVDSVVLLDVRPLWAEATFRWLYHNEVNLRAGFDRALQCACRLYSREVIMYLIKKGSCAVVDLALPSRVALEKNDVELFQFLECNGASSVTSYNFRESCIRGYTELMLYMMEGEDFWLFDYTKAITEVIEKANLNLGSLMEVVNLLESKGGKLDPICLTFPSVKSDPKLKEYVSDHFECDVCDCFL